jgi:hypothetical protein
MKKIYIIPETHMVNLNLLNSVLGGEPSIGKLSQGAAGGDEPGFGDAKGNDEVVDDDDLGYSPIQTDWSTE